MLKRVNRLKIIRHVQLRKELFIDVHKLSDERFKMKNVLGAGLHPVLVLGGELERLCLDGHITIVNQLFDQAAEYEIRWNALRE